MTIGQYGFDHHKARAANRTHRAQTTISTWAMGRRHLSDDIDHALARLIRGREPTSKRERRQMVLTLREWVVVNPHLPADLVQAIKDLLPEVGQGSMADDWEVG